MSHIAGLSIDYTSDIELTFKGNPISIAAAKATLTVENKSIKAQLRQLKKMTPRSPRHAASLNWKIKELEGKERHELYSENEDGTLSVPPGYWYLGEMTSESHKSSIKPIFLNDERYYQREIVEELLKYKRSCITAATGTGKSRVIRDLALSYVNADKRVLVCVPSIELLDQTADSIDDGLQRVFGVKCGRLGDGKKPKDGKEVVVSTIQSAINVVDRFDAVVFDECFLENARIQTDKGLLSFKEIWNSKEEYSALSWNERTGKREFRKIVAKHRKERDLEILKIKSEQGEVSCTSNHKFFTSDGWKEASELNKGDLVLGHTESKKKPPLFLDSLRKQLVLGSFLGDGCVLETKKRQRVVFTHGAEQEIYLRAKIAALCGSARSKEKNGFAQKPAFQGNSATFLKIPFLDGKRKGHLPIEIAEELEWFGFGIWIMDDGTFTYNSKKEVNGLVLQVCSFSEESLKPFLNQINEKFNIHGSLRNYKYPTIHFNKEDAQKIKHEIESFGVIEGMYKFSPKKKVSFSDPVFCSEVREIQRVNVSKIRGVDTRYVYDIEVEGNHNFYVQNSPRKSSSRNFLLAHNCHIVSAESYQRVAAGAINAQYMHGLTATIDRPDGLTPLIHAWCGKRVYEYSYKMAVEDGFLAPIKYHSKRIGSLAQTWGKMQPIKEYIALHSDDKFIDELEKITRKSLDSGRKTLVLFKASECCEKLASRFGVSAANGKYRQPLREFIAGKSDLLIGNTALLSTGLDIPEISSLILVMGGTSEIVFLQCIGRGTRLAKGKKDCIVVDISVNHPKYIQQGKTRLEIAKKTEFEICSV